MKIWPYVILLVLAAHMFTVHSLVIKSGTQWQAEKQTNNTPNNKNEPSCLKVSDFYSVHLTAYFLAAGDDEKEPKEQAKRYMQVCDRIPGTGQVIFTVDLMEQDARDVPVALSLLHFDSRGELIPVKELPADRHPRGVMTLDTAIAERGKYVLKVAFGDAKSKDDIIEMPISVGQ